MVKQAKAELVDGKYAVNIGDKAAKDYVTEFLGTEEGKHFKAASANGGGGAGGGKPGDARGQDDARAQNSMRCPIDCSTPSSKKAAKIVDA
jgi:hypothetical protein